MMTKARQNTLTCIIVALAPLQFLATAVQMLLSYIYPLSTFFMLSAIVVALAILVNVSFQLWFDNSFNNKKYPDIIERKVRLFKMTRAEAKKHMVWKDERFIAHKNGHKCMSLLTSILTATLGFKLNKLYYSFFYDLSPFKAHFTRAKYYRKFLTWY